MYSDYLINSRIKGLDYAADHSRLRRISRRKFSFRGNHSTHLLKLQKEGHMSCDCYKFCKMQKCGHTPVCPHVVAGEKILRDRAQIISAENGHQNLLTSPTRSVNQKLNHSPPVAIKYNGGVLCLVEIY